MPLVSFSPGQVISSANVNANFGLCVLTDTSRTISVTHTYSATQTFAAGWTAATGCTISSGGLTANAVTISTAVGKVIPGATSLSFRNNADSADNLLISDAGVVTARASMGAPILLVDSTQNASGVFRVTGSGTGYAFCRMTNTGGDAFWGVESSVGGTLMTGTSAYASVFGSVEATSLAFCTSGTQRVSITAAGAMAFSVAASKIVPGATSLSLRNNADSADNLLISDPGVVTLRNNVVTANAKAIIGRNAAGTQDVRMIEVSSTDYITIGSDTNQAGVIVGGFGTSKKIGFYASTGATQQTVTGSRGSNAALASLLTALATLGLIVDSSS